MFGVQHTLHHGAECVSEAWAPVARRQPEAMANTYRRKPSRWRCRADCWMTPAAWCLSLSSPGIVQRWLSTAGCPPVAPFLSTRAVDALCHREGSLFTKLHPLPAAHDGWTSDGRCGGSHRPKGAVQLWSHHCRPHEGPEDALVSAARALESCSAQTLLLESSAAALCCALSLFGSPPPPPPPSRTPATPFSYAGRK